MTSDVLHLKPKSDKVNAKNLGFSALVHGNEILGLPILNTLIRALLNGTLRSSHSFYFALGNLEAFHRNVRFVEKDLNRCFGLKEATNGEERRAKELEVHFLNHLDYLIDLHQTVQASFEPFFIFQYSSPMCYRHLAKMNRNFSVVLQFDNIGDDQGLSTDEYLRSRGKFGVALELGQLGWSESQFKNGLQACLRLVANADQDVPGKMDGAQIFEIAERFPCPLDDVILRSELVNFSSVEKDEIVGQSGVEFVRAPRGGRVLFPKLNRLVKSSENLFFICSEIPNARKSELGFEL